MMPATEPRGKPATDWQYRACANPECATVWQIKREQAKDFRFCGTCGAELRPARKAAA